MTAVGSCRRQRPKSREWFMPSTPTGTSTRWAPPRGSADREQTRIIFLTLVQIAQLNA